MYRCSGVYHPSRSSYDVTPEILRLSCQTVCRVVGQLVDVTLCHAQEVEDVQEAVAVQTGGCFELDHALGAPGDAQAGGVQHEKVVGAVANSHRLGNGDVVLRRERLEN